MSVLRVDAGCRYRLSNVVGLSVTVVSPAKTAQLIEILFRLKTWVGPRNHILDKVQIPVGTEGAVLRGKCQPTVKYRDTGEL